MVVNKKNNLGYDSVFPYNDNLALPISQMELDINSTIPIIVPKKPNSVTPNLTNSPVTSKATLTSSKTNTETLSPCNCRSALLNIKSSKNNIFKVEAQLLGSRC